MDVIVSKYIGIRSTAILARCRYDDILKRYPKWLVDEASKFDEDLDCKEVLISLTEGAVYAKEYTEYGVFEALFQMSKELRCGLRINIKDIPIKQETVEISEFFKLNPYAAYSGGSAVIVAEDGKAVVKALEDANIPSSIVGYTTNDNDKLIINEEESGFLQHIRKDELKNILGRREYYERTNSGNC